MRSKWLLTAALAISVSAWAASPADLLDGYAAQAKREDAAFSGFSAARGDTLFRTVRQHSKGGKVSCAGCHTENPRNAGKTRANKEIAPLAPGANPERFTDSAKTEKWFRRNCEDVLERACSAREKGDLITWLLSIK